MGKHRIIFITLVLFIALLSAASTPAFCSNLLVNGGFEDSPIGTKFYLDPGTQPVPGQWWAEGETDPNLFDGVFDSSWHFPPPPNHPDWPTNFGPFEGAQYLGRYNPPISTDPPIVEKLDKISGAVYQMVPVVSGTTYTLSSWYVGYHPQGLGGNPIGPKGMGAGLRIGIDPTGAVDPVSGKPDWGSADIIWYPAITEQDGKLVDNFYYSNSWKQLQVQAQAQNSQITVWVQYCMTTNETSQPQIVQADGVTLSDQVVPKPLYCREVEALGVTYFPNGSPPPGPPVASYSLRTKVTDGTDPVNNATVVFEWGPTTSYGSTATRTSPDSAGYYSVPANGLTLDGTYYYRITASCAGYETTVVTGSFKAYRVLYQSDPVETDLSASGVTISWDTYDNANRTLPVATMGYLEYGTDDNYVFLADDPTGLTSHHSITLDGLLPSTTYKYRVVAYRPEGGGITDPYGKSVKYKDSNGNVLTFQTQGAGFFNGDFEQANSFPIDVDDPIPGWTKFASTAYPGDPGWYPSGAWAVPAQHGLRYVLYPSNGSGGPLGGMFQNFPTTPGQFLVASAWVWTESWNPRGYPDDDPTQWPEGVTQSQGPHRFGETSAKIGIDPTGGIDPGSSNIIWSSDRETLDWLAYVATKHAEYGWQKLQVGVVAGSSATIFLKLDCLWANPWVLAGFDNVSIDDTPTNVSSVAEAKQLDNDRAISLSGNVVVTAVYNYDTPSCENFGKSYFYIEDEDGTAGIRVVMADGSDVPTDIAVGKRVSIDGMITWGHFYEPSGTKAGFYDQQQRLNKPAGERVIRALPGRITVGPDGTLPKVVGMTNRDLCGGSSSDHWFTNPGVDGGVGANNVGKLVRIWGRITEVNLVSSGPYAGGYYLVIDDGSGVPRYGSKPGDEKYGVFVDIGEADYTPFMNLSPHVGEYAVITGIAVPALDFDWDDTPQTPGTEPEAMKNVRSIKPLSFDAPNIIFVSGP